MKAILMTRRDEAKKDPRPPWNYISRFQRIAGRDCKRTSLKSPNILSKYRHVFNEWRYFEPGAPKDAILALVDTDRIWGLGKGVQGDH